MIKNYTFKSVNEALPNENDVYPDIIKTFNPNTYETEAKWEKGKGFEVFNEKFDTNRYVVS
ncbi:hypothetical protein ES711_02380 [Gelidibacter salicanalis]|uniref:Uncharacterized protein n=1 Tax=Gelidibacter salicanalis TaxID=291193 RepID=A0A5C7ARW8_9FLAO|nr:hypothetical protein [Gelidibacter salicanalis]TXE10774.1 hypothetical protein ES711_02380 [Gelidibacter salicanalis]